MCLIDIDLSVTVFSAFGLVMDSSIFGVELTASVNLKDKASGTSSPNVFKIIKVNKICTNMLNEGNAPIF